MGDNSNNMSLEDKIVQTLKDEKLFELVGDEDAINELVHRAINEALFKGKKTKNKWGEVTGVALSPVQEAAKEVAEKMCNEAVPKVIEEIMASEDFKKAVMQIIAASVPSVLAQSFHLQIQNVAMEEVNRLREKINESILDGTFSQAML